MLQTLIDLKALILKLQPTEDRLQYQVTCEGYAAVQHGGGCSTRPPGATQGRALWTQVRAPG